MPAPSLAEFKDFLNWGDDLGQRDAELLRVLATGVEWVEGAAGPFQVQAFSVAVTTCGGSFFLPVPRPVTVTVVDAASVNVPVLAIDAAAWRVTTRIGRYGVWTVTGTHGWATPPANLTEAALVVATMNFRQRRRGLKRDSVEGQSEPRAALPRARELIAAYVPPAMG